MGAQSLPFGMKISRGIKSSLKFGESMWEAIRESNPFALSSWFYSGDYLIKCYFQNFEWEPDEIVSPK